MTVEEEIRKHIIDVGILVLAPMVQARIINELTKAENETKEIISEGFQKACSQYLTLRNAQIRYVLDRDVVLGVVAKAEAERNQKLRQLIEKVETEADRIITKIDENGCKYEHRKTYREVTLLDLGGYQFIKKLKSLLSEGKGKSQPPKTETKQQ